MSPKYKEVLLYYKRGFWSKAKVHDAVGKYITAEEYELITGEPYA
jgi:hypothetical protein